MTDLSKIDYSPLTKEFLVSQPVKVDMAVYVLIPVCLALFIGVSQFKSMGTVGWLITAVLVLFAGLYGHRLGLQKARRDKSWQEFAARNRWKLTKDKAVIPPSIDGVGHSKHRSPVLKANFAGREVFIFTYNFEKGYGKYAEQFYYTIAHIRVMRDFPHLILDSKKTPKAIQNKGSATAQVKLEGNFPKFFSLWYAPNERTEALSVITPDVMQTLIKYNPMQDIEIISDNVFFMVQSTKRDAEEVRALLEAVAALAAEIAHKAQTINYVA